MGNETLWYISSIYQCSSRRTNLCLVSFRVLREETMPYYGGICMDQKQHQSYGTSAWLSAWQLQVCTICSHSGGPSLLAQKADLNTAFETNRPFSKFTRHTASESNVVLHRPDMGPVFIPKRGSSPNIEFFISLTSRNATSASWWKQSHQKKITFRQGPVGLWRESVQKFGPRGHGTGLLDYGKNLCKNLALVVIETLPRKPLFHLPDFSQCLH